MFTTSNSKNTFKSLIITVVFGLYTWVLSPAVAGEFDRSDWVSVQDAAKGQTVYFNAWGGSERINAYLQWAAEELKTQHGIVLEHVKVADIAEVVSQIEAAHAAGRHDNGNVDLMWVNGENFAALKRQKLLFGPFASDLPNSVKVADSDSLKFDFSVPVDDMESPWGRAQLVFIHDRASVSEPPRSARALLDFVLQGGRFVYPAPPAFHGTTFLKQLLLELATDVSALSRSVEEADFAAVSAPLWAYLDELHPRLVGNATRWPKSGEETRQMLDDGESDIALSFNPNEASAAVRNGQLPDSVRTYIFDGGTIGNTHFVAIPYNASASAAAMVVADFLLSPEAQARKADPRFWGDPSVLDSNRLTAEEASLFEAVDPGPWSLATDSINVLPEPHASWTEALEREWIKRYGS